MRRLSVLIIVALATAGLGGCAFLRGQLQAPTVSYQDYRLEAVSLQGATLNFRLNLDNPNGFEVPIKGLSYRLKLHGKDLLSGRIQPEARIPARGSVVVDVPVRVVYTQFLAGLGELLQQRSVAYELKGEIDFGLLQVPYATRGEFPLPELPSLQVAGVKVSRMDFSGVEMGVQVQLHNNNAFPIHLDRIDYHLNLAGKPVLQGGSTQALDLAPGGVTKMNLGVRIGYQEAAALIDLITQGKRIAVDMGGQLQLPAQDGKGSTDFGWKGEVPVFR